MENPTVSGLRSRSRSKTPFLRSSCDHENCTEGEEHTHHKSGRRTPVKRSTPIKQLQQNSKKSSIEPVEEEVEEVEPVHRTRQSTRSEKLIKTSDYSSEESLDRLRGHRKEIIQNEINSQYERVSTSTQGYSTLVDVTLSPINVSRNVTQDRSRRFSSPAYSACSTDSSFAEQALADASVLLDREPNSEHLPYRLYKMAGEYWNKYPKTDYTYSPLSRDRVELAPGQVAVPNMSRRSLSQFRVQGPNTVDEPDIPYTSVWKTSTVRKRITTVDSSDDESAYYHTGAAQYTKQERWFLTRLLLSIITSITNTTSNAYRKVVGPAHRYPYTERRPKAGVMSSAASVMAAPFYWVYTLIKTVVTTTVTTVTETFTSDHVSENEKYTARLEKGKTRRRWWPWLLLLLLPACGYGCYTYKDYFINDKPIDNYKSPEVMIDADLAKRIAALENWALNVDSKLKNFDQKLVKFDNLESKIEQYSFRYLQNNLIQILTDDNTDAMAAKLKERFDKIYATNEQMQSLSQEILERLITSWKPEMDEDSIRKVIQEYLLTIEKRQTELIVEKVREYIKEVEVRTVESGTVDLEAVKKLVAGMLEVYDADKTGLVDYALESAGGQVLSTKCTELYQIKTKQYSVLGIPVLWSYTSPRNALTPGALPAECWAFQGFPGYLVIKTYAIIEVTGFSIEHMSRLLAVDGKIESAPKNFSVYGLQGEYDPEPHLFGSYMYDANGTSIQHFSVMYPKVTTIDGVEYPVAHDIIELRVESNHGNPTYTCLYRFRVHGNPVRDIHSINSET